MSKFIVTKEAMHPASPNHKCFYCDEPTGGFHKDSCVLVSKKVKVRMTVEYEVEVPNHWGKYQIEFHRNEGSWCADNAIEELKEHFSGELGCMCNAAEFEYLEDTSEGFLKER